jgi:hypothetical protein
LCGHRLRRRPCYRTRRNRTRTQQRIRRWYHRHRHRHGALPGLSRPRTGHRRRGPRTTYHAISTHHGRRTGHRTRRTTPRSATAAT